MCKLCKYVIIKNGVLCVLETDRMKEVIRNELGVFDYRDYIFDDDPSVYLLVKDFSIYDDDTTIIYRGYLNDCDGVFNGTVIFTKMDELGFGNCTNTRACEAECPKNISISNIARLNRDFIIAKLKD